MPKLGAFSFFDYQSVEPRLAAYFLAQLGYPAFAGQIKAGIDPYTAVAQTVTGRQEIPDSERTKWKVMFLSLMYGGGIKTIQLQFGVKASVASKMIREFHVAWPAFGVLQGATQRAHARKGYIVTPWGRHLHAEEHGEHKLLNKLIQGSAADLIKQALIRVDHFLRESYALNLRSHMVSVIHDELILDGPVDELAILHKDIPYYMRDERIHEVVPIEVDHEVSLTTWADKAPYEEVTG